MPAVQTLRFRGRVDRLTTGALLVLALVLLTVNLTAWPESWFDEGLNLATASTLAEEGVYGLPDSGGTREMDPAIQTGPPVIVPVALAFWAFGSDLLAPRLVMAAFGLLALAAYLVLARRLVGAAGAAIAIGLLLIGSGDPFTSFVPLSRQVLGEVPALGFFCFGMWLLSRHVDAPTRSTLFAGITVGVCFGLAMVTKSQMALVLAASLGVFWLLNLFYYKVIDRWLALIALVTAVGIVLSWYATQIFVVGYEGYRANQEVLREGFGIHIARLSLSGPEAALRTLWSTGFVLWGLPGLAYGALLARRRTMEGLLLSLPLLVIVVWLAWYTFLSIGWSRYAALPLLLAPLFTARLVIDVVRGQTRLAIPERWQKIVPLGMAAVVLGFAMVVLRTDIPQVVNPPARDHQSITAYLQEEISAGAVIETWAWELDSFVPQRLHHPPTGVTNAYTLLIWDGTPVSSEVYDPLAAAPDYVLENSFSAWTGIYADLISTRGEQVAAFGAYRLYAIR